jgi:predicted aldo/keto reductase-like oxidoreductase
MAVTVRLLGYLSTLFVFTEEFLQFWGASELLQAVAASTASFFFPVAKSARHHFHGAPGPIASSLCSTTNPGLSLAIPKDYGMLTVSLLTHRWRFMKRRDFLKGTTAAATMLGCFPATLSGVEREKSKEGIERRSLGRTGVKLSIIGFGSFMLRDASPEQARDWVRDAYESGVNYFDVAPSYGPSEELLGPALEPYREKVFLACKTNQRNKNGAVAELDQSLKRLRTDHFDLYQLHHVTTLDEVNTIFGENGAIKAFEEAKAAGKVRFLGFSAHSVEAAMALLDRFNFDTLLFPVNYATWHTGNFGPQVLAKASEKQMGILALKAMAKRPWPEGADRKAHPICWYEPMTDPEEALMGLRFTLSHPVTAAVSPASHQCFKTALQVIPRFKPLTAKEAEEMKRRAMAEKPIFKYPRAEQAANRLYYSDIEPV